jgi:hypothetical protein
LSELKDQLSKINPDGLAGIIGQLAGEKSNLKIEVSELRFNVGGRDVKVTGMVNFDVVRDKKTGGAGHEV